LAAKDEQAKELEKAVNTVIAKGHPRSDQIERRFRDACMALAELAGVRPFSHAFLLRGTFGLRAVFGWTLCLRFGRFHSWVVCQIAVWFDRHASVASSCGLPRPYLNITLTTQRDLVRKLLLGRHVRASNTRTR
jgi:hypothetical protein